MLTLSRSKGACFFFSFWPILKLFRFKLTEEQEGRTCRATKCDLQMIFEKCLGWLISCWLQQRRQISDRGVGRRWQPQSLHPPIDRSHTDCQLVGRLETLTDTLIWSLDVISSDIFRLDIFLVLKSWDPLLSVDNVAPAQRDGSKLKIRILWLFRMLPRWMLLYSLVPLCLGGFVEEAWVS